MRTAGNSTVRLPRLRSVEAAKFLEHQMFFWGKDVLHGSGNLLVAFGCRSFRRPDAPHHVSCYQVESDYGCIVLHSTGVLLRPGTKGEGVAYLRPVHRLFHVPCGEMPLPCNSLKCIPRLLRAVTAREFPACLARLLMFVRAYETWAAARLEPGARLEAWREHRHTARAGIKWLPPRDSACWLDACLAAVEAHGIAG